MLIMLTLLLSSGIFNIFSSLISGEDCINGKDENIECKKNWVTAISLGNKISNEKLINIQSILNLVSIILIIILLQFFRRT